MRRILLFCFFPLVPLFILGCSSGSSTSSTAPDPTASASLSASSFDFGGNLVGNSLSKPVVTVTNTGSTSLTLQPALSGDPSYAVVPTGSCGASLAAGAACSVNVSYTPTTASGASAQTATLSLGIAGVSSTTPQTVALTGSSATLAAGTVTATNNPQVALYTVNLPFPGSISVSFGQDTSYGRNTWSQTSAIAGPVSVLVAGMLGNTTYHMRAALQFANGLSANDADHTFTTGASEVQPALTASTSPGLTPSSGVEQLTIITGPTVGLAVTDLGGNVLWSYALQNPGPSNIIEGARLLDNGHFLVSIDQGSGAPLDKTPITPNTVLAIREFDLAGDTIRELTAAVLNNALQARGYNLTILQLHHEVTPLPNGHWLILGNVFKAFTDLPGYPGTTNVLGDVVIDLDTNLQPVWVWNEFDHLDVNRHPLSFPDWTHTNAITYSPDDGNIFVSMRHQNWVVKVDYNNGAGTGNILWHLGYQGDFTLKNGVDPTDWPYAQHYPSLFSKNSTGSFSLGLMDNGNDRIFPTGVVCGSAGAPACLYTTIPVYQVDETAKTATLTFHQILPTNLYSSFGGNTELLANGNIEYDLAGTSATTSDLFEVTNSSTPQTVWQMHLTGGLAYRGFRIPSLYPGVQW